MSIETFREKCKQAAKEYYGELPFHNFSHAERVEQRAYELTKLLELDGLTTKWIILGARMHDAGYHHPLPIYFTTKEDYSIHLMEQVVNEILAPSYPNIVKQIKVIAADGIEWTKLDCTNFSTEARRVLRAADIPNLGDPDETLFFTNSAKIYREINILHAKELPFPVDTFQEGQIPLLTTLLKNTQEWLAEDTYFFAGYYDNFRANIARALDPTFKEYI